MKELKHKVMRIGENYQVQRMFKADGINAMWITKRIGYPNTPGAFVLYRFLNQAIKDIRAETAEKKSFIILDKSVLKHLKSINFDDKSIKLLIGNEEDNSDG